MRHFRGSITRLDARCLRFMPPLRNDDARLACGRWLIFTAHAFAWWVPSEKFLLPFTADSFLLPWIYLGAIKGWPL